jgi:hypothetical protein
MREERDFPQIDAGLLDTRHDAIDRIGRRRRLFDTDQPCRLIHDADIGESATDIHGNAQILHRTSPSLMLFDEQDRALFSKNEFVVFPHGRRG